MPKCSGKRLEKSMKQQAFLTKVNELKHEIFEQFSLTITKESKKKAWTLIKDYAVSIGLVTQDKDYTYVRDATWPNLRNRTMIKIDKSKKTGEGGGSNSKLDDCDKLVLEIIGKESPVIQGIGVYDSLEQNETNENEIKLIPPDTLNADENVPKMRNNSVEADVSTRCLKKRVMVRKPEHIKTLEDLKKKKLELEIRKLQLEVWEKETLLGVDHCSATEGISSTNNEERDSLFVDENGEYVIINEE